MKCKHNHGWCCEKSEHLFINSNGELQIGFNGWNKFVAICNYPGCGARRNIYINNGVVKFGKIRYNKL